jgi:phosphoglycolate phosphatase-like HAD superfamily hydrolase
LGRDPRGVLLIGDTPDDAVAARQVGAGVILFDGGSHHLPALKAMGAPVAHTLGETIDLALSVAKGGTLAGIG